MNFLNFLTQTTSCKLALTQPSTLTSAASLVAWDKTMPRTMSFSLRSQIPNKSSNSLPKHLSKNSPTKDKHLRAKRQEARRAKFKCSPCNSSLSTSTCISIFNFYQKNWKIWSILRSCPNNKIHLLRSK